MISVADLPAFLTTLRHDFRNHLGHVRGFAELAAESFASAGRHAEKQSLEKLRGESGDLANLITLTLVPSSFSTSVAGVLHARIVDFSDHTIRTSSSLALVAHALQMPQEVEDLARIQQAAKHIREASHKYLHNPEILPCI